MSLESDVISSLVSGAGGAAPALALIWYLLKDLKTSVQNLASTSGDSKVMEARFDERIKNIEKANDELKRDVTLMTSRMDAAFRNIDKLKGVSYVEARDQ